MQMKHEQTDCNYNTLFHRFHLAEEINYIYLEYVVLYRQASQCYHIASCEFIWRDHATKYF